MTTSDALADVADALAETLADLIVPADPAHLGVGGDVTVVDVRTYAELGILCADLGFVVRLSDGRGVALKITEYHR